VGVVGLGNIGGELLKLLAPFEMRCLASDPLITPMQAAAQGAELVDLGTLLRQSDFVCLNCPLTAQTRGLIGAAELGLMKPTAFLVNTARGPVVDQAALVDALRRRQIRGAALDVFETEPLPQADALLSLDNVILTPHAICFTDEVAAGNGRGAIDAVLAIAAGGLPEHMVNGDVIERPGFKAKLSRYRRPGDGAAP
jgi:phosphoglycerate dehydrogenase-like enzyme